MLVSDHDYALPTGGRRPGRRARAGARSARALFLGRRPDAGHVAALSRRGGARARSSDSLGRPPRNDRRAGRPAITAGVSYRDRRGTRDAGCGDRDAGPRAQDVAAASAPVRGRGAAGVLGGTQTTGAGGGGPYPPRASRDPAPPPPGLPSPSTPHQGSGPGPPKP